MDLRIVVVCGVVSWALLLWWRARSDDFSQGVIRSARTVLWTLVAAALVGVMIANGWQTADIQGTLAWAAIAWVVLIWLRARKGDLRHGAGRAVGMLLWTLVVALILGEVIHIALAAGVLTFGDD
jgi:hypothetical protein